MHAVRISRPLASAVAFLLLTCKDVGGPSRALTSISVSPGTVNFTALGEARTLAATARDQNGNAMAGVTVIWSTDDGAIAGVSSAGVVTAAGNGVTVVRATSGSVQGTATATVASPSVEAVSGNDQTGLAGFGLNVSPAVIVRDAAGHLLPGATVTFAATSGGGSVTGASVLSGVDGVARVGSWTVQLGANALAATLPGAAGSPVTFTATGIARAYDIVLRFLTSVTPAQQAAFDSAEARWERLLYGELPDVSLALPASCAGVSLPAGSETVDDLLIFVRLESIDGPGNVLGSAGLCSVRQADLLPVLGAMRFDTADVTTFLNRGLFDEIVMHEIGHVIGLGTLWQPRDLLQDPSLPPLNGSDPHLIGVEAIAAFDRSGGASYTAGAKVPVENTGGRGTADGHWRESVFDAELMTGFLDNAVANPLSVISAAQFADLGYRLVNHAASDAYSVANPLALRLSTGMKYPFGDDVHHGAVEVVDARGRMVTAVRIP